MKFHWFHGMPWPHLHDNWYLAKHLGPRWANAPSFSEPRFDERIASGTLIAGSPESLTEHVDHWSPKPLNTVHRFDQSRTAPNKTEQARTLELAGVN